MSKSPTPCVCVWCAACTSGFVCSFLYFPSRSFPATNSLMDLCVCLCAHIVHQDCVCVSVVCVICGEIGASKWAYRGWWLMWCVWRLEMGGQHDEDDDEDRTKRDAARRCWFNLREKPGRHNCVFVCGATKTVCVVCVCVCRVCAHWAFVGCPGHCFVSASSVRGCVGLLLYNMSYGVCESQLRGCLRLAPHDGFLGSLWVDRLKWCGHWHILYRMYKRIIKSVPTLTLYIHTILG